jgi:hypothetical protein
MRQILAEGINGNDLAWSSDSRYIYASKPKGDMPQIVRVSPNRGAVESVLNLSSLNGLSSNVSDGERQRNLFN